MIFDYSLAGLVSLHKNVGARDEAVALPILGKGNHVAVADAANLQHLHRYMVA